VSGSHTQWTHIRLTETIAECPDGKHNICSAMTLGAGADIIACSQDATLAMSHWRRDFARALASNGSRLRAHNA
jgi:hypothetical protein